MKSIITKIKCITIYISLVMSNNMFAIVMGSESAVSVQPNMTFPASDSDNTMLGFAWFKNGVTLQNASTTCLFNDVFPITGPVSLNGGTLTLDEDLNFGYNVTLQSLGTIIANGNSVNFPRSVTALPTTSNTFQDVNLFINNDVILNSQTLFKGNCVVNGNGNALVLGPTGSILIAPGARLELHDVALEKVNGFNVQCLDSAGVLVLNKATWFQDANFTFTLGALLFENDVVMEGNSIFAYQSNQTFTVLADSNLTLDSGFTFSYDPGTSPDLFEFVDPTSMITLNNATLYSTLQGLNLINGTMVVNGAGFLASETPDNSPAYGISFGDNNGNEFMCAIAAGATLEVSLGTLNFKDVNQSSLTLGSSATLLYIFDNTTINLCQTINMGPGVLQFGNNTTCGFASGTTINGSVSELGSVTFTDITC